jgi:hypothetical protein
MAFVVISTPTAYAQNQERSRLFAGYSWANTELDFRVGPIVRSNSSGWTAAISHDLSDIFGLTAAFAGHYGSAAPLGEQILDYRVHEFLFGPHIGWHREKVRVFAHFLFGGILFDSTHITLDRLLGRIDVGLSGTHFAIDFGAGLDINISRRFGVRLVQLDILPVDDRLSWTNNVRLASGAVFRF